MIATARESIDECRLAASSADGALVRLANELRKSEQHSRRIEVEGLRDHVLYVLARLRHATGGEG